MPGKFLFIFSCLERCANRHSLFLFLACFESLTATRTLSTPRLERCANSPSLVYF